MCRSLCAAQLDKALQNNGELKKVRAALQDIWTASGASSASLAALLSDLYAVALEVIARFPAIDVSGGACIAPHRIVPLVIKDRLASWLAGPPTHPPIPSFSVVRVAAGSGGQTRSQLRVGGMLCSHALVRMCVWRCGCVQAIANTLDSHFELNLQPKFRIRDIITGNLSLPE